MVDKGGGSAVHAVLATEAASNAQQPRQHRVTASLPCVRNCMTCSRPPAQLVFLGAVLQESLAEELTLVHSLCLVMCASCQTAASRRPAGALDDAHNV